MAQICISEQFIEPKFIPELGEDGLTAEEIAISLQVPLNAIHKKLSRGKWLSGEIKDWRITTYVFQQEINLFGETEVVRFDKVKMSLLNPLEQCQATLAHLELINEGISRRRKREHQILQNEIYKQRTIEIKSSNPSS